MAELPVFILPVVPKNESSCSLSHAHLEAILDLWRDVPDEPNDDENDEVFLTALGRLDEKGCKHVSSIEALAPLVAAELMGFVPNPGAAAERLVRFAQGLINNEWLLDDTEFPELIRWLAIGAELGGTGEPPHGPLASTSPEQVVDIDTERAQNDLPPSVAAFVNALSKLNHAAIRLACASKKELLYSPAHSADERLAAITAQHARHEELITSIRQALPLIPKVDPTLRPTVGEMPAVTAALLKPVLQGLKSQLMGSGGDVPFGEWGAGYDDSVKRVWETARTLRGLSFSPVSMAPVVAMTRVSDAQALVDAKRAAAKALRAFLSFVEALDTDKNGNRVCPNDRPTLEKKWGDAVEACNAVYRTLLVRLPKREDMMIALEDMPSDEREVFDLLSQALGLSGITRYTPDGKPWLDAVMRSPEVPPVGLRVVEADRIRKLDSIATLLEASDAPVGSPRMAPHGAPIDDTSDDRDPPKKPKVTKADVDIEIQERKGRMGPHKFADLIRKVAKGDRDARVLARNTFGRNEIARHLDCSGSVVSESPRWGEIADQLQLRPRRSSVRNKQGLDVVIEHKATEGPPVVDEAVIQEVRSRLGQVSSDTAKLIVGTLENGEMTVAQAHELIRLESKPDEDESPP